MDNKGKISEIKKDENKRYIEQKQVESPIYVCNNINKLIVGRAGSGKRFTIRDGDEANDSRN